MRRIAICNTGNSEAFAPHPRSLRNVNSDADAESADARDPIVAQSHKEEEDYTIEEEYTQTTTCTQADVETEHRAPVGGNSARSDKLDHFPMSTGVSNSATTIAYYSATPTPSDGQGP